MSNHLGDTNKMVGEDHIRDATKMVSDTPRTDAVNQYLRTRRDYTKTDHEVCMKHGMELERELNAANQRIKRLEEAGDKIVESGWSVQDWSGMCVVWAKAKEAKP